MMTLGERLKIAREHAQLSQEQLGEQAACGQGVVSKIERGDQEKSSYVVQLAVACKVRPQWLAMEEGDMVENVGYSADPLVSRVVAAMQHMKEEDRRYVVITSEAIITNNAPSVDDLAMPQKRGAQELPEKPAQPETKHKLKIRRFSSIPGVVRVKPKSTPTVNSKLKREKKK